MSQIIPIYIPTYINNAEYSPARVLPRLFFYNGLIDCETYWIESGSAAFGGVTYQQNAFPYFDNYNVVTGSFPTVDSDSLLFTNENASYGEIPIGSLYTDYWETYISLLYNPKTRLLNCSAIIPLADYFQMELNDIVNFRGNYYHLRAINDYSLKTGECNLQLLGPILGTTFSAEAANTPTTTTTLAPTTTTTTISGSTTTTTTFSPDPCICTEVVITSAGGEVATTNCYGVNENYVYFSAGTYYLCAASIGGLLQAFITAGTGTVSPVGNCKTQTCPPGSTTTTTAGTTTTTTAATTTTTTAGGTTTTSTTTTTLAPGCYNYQVINTSIGTFNDWLYVQCGENFSRSYDLPGYSTSSFCIQDAKYSIGSGLVITNTGACTTTTLAPASCNTWVLSEGSSEVWYGNYLNCYNQAISGAYVDSQGAPVDSFICAIGTPERISGGFINPSGSCATTTTTSTTTTTLAPGCYLYSLYLPSGPTVNFGYVPCATTSSASIGISANETYNVCIEYDKYERGTSVVVTNLGACTTTTIAPGACQTWILDPGSSNLWYGNYLDCYGAAISGAFVDSYPDYICAVGVPQRISGGNLITSGSCATTTTTSTTTTTLPLGCFIYDVVNTGAGSAYFDYQYCNGQYVHQELAGSNASMSVCVLNNNISSSYGFFSFVFSGTPCTTSTTTTTTTTAAPTTTTTTLALGCFTYEVINPSAGPIFNFEYVFCGENFSRSIELPATSTSSLCIQDDKWERGTGAIVTRGSLCTTTTLAPGTCNTWVLDPGSSTLWYGNYLNCYNQAVSGAFVDSAPDYICAIGTPERISGGFLIVSGSCTTTTSTTTTTAAPGCFIYDVVNNGTGTGFVNYVYCGNGSTYQQFFLAGGASGSICVDNYQINSGGNLNMVATLTTGSCAATTTTSTTTTTTTTAAPTTTTTSTTTTTTSTTTTTTAAPTTTTTTTLATQKYYVESCAGPGDIVGVIEITNAPLLTSKIIRLNTNVAGLSCFQVFSTSTGTITLGTRSVTNIYTDCVDCTD